MTPPDRLFVYGTLCDATLLELVAGCSWTSLSPVVARLPGHGVYRAMDAAFPILNPSDGEAEGILLQNVTPEAWGRLLFYEGDEYTAKEIVVVRADGKAMVASTFWPSCLTATETPWSLSAETKIEALRTAASHYMAAYGKDVDLDTHWLASQRLAGLV